jgi:predicted permease
MNRFLLKLFRRRKLENDIEEELRFHREMSGPIESHAPFGNPAVIKEQALDLWRFTTLENLWRDVIYGVRGLRRHPSLVATALLSLMLGIGANTALFSLGVEFLLSEPSVTDGASLVYVQFNDSSHADKQQMEIAREAKLFADVAGENEESLVNWNNGHETRPIFSTVTTKNFFTMLGVPMALGRGYAVTDPDQVVVLHHHFWTQHFNRDPNIVGQSITLDGRAYTVVGVLPEHFRSLIGFGFADDVYLPSFLDGTYLALYARLNPGMTLDQAKAASLAIANRVAEARAAGKRPEHAEASVQAIAGFARLRSQQMLAVGTFFIILLTLAGLVLLIACANVASLLLARASSRRREIAVRLSLGASRARLMQQLLVESLLLSVTGALGGLLLAQLLSNALSQMTAPTPVPMRLTAESDWRVALYAALLSVVATAACGLLPAWQSVRESFSGDLQRSGRMLLRRAIVVGQVAVSIVILSIGILFVRNLLKSSALSPGFDVQHTLRAEVDLPPAQYKDNPKKIALYAEQGVRQLSALPGVEAAAAARIIPFVDNTRFDSQIRFTGVEQSVHASFNWNGITSGYFTAMSIPIVAGRGFQATDAGTPEKPIVVSTGFVKQFLARQPLAAVGQTFQWGERKAEIYRIVGVAANTKNMSIGEAERAQLYEYLPNVSEARSRLQFVVRSATPPVSQLKAVSDALRAIEPNAGLEAQTMFSSIGFAFLPSQIGAAVLGSMGLLGLVLAMIGLYGVMAYSVARRTQEIGVRMAIGAQGSSIMKLILNDAGRMVAIGSAIGIAVALIATRPLASFLVDGLPPHDPVTFLAVLVVFTITAALASWGPARRAMAIDPMSCLRHD